MAKKDTIYDLIAASVLVSGVSAQAIPAACYETVNYADVVIQSLGLVQDLCSCGHSQYSILTSALCSVGSCLSRNLNPSVLATSIATVLGLPNAYCADYYRISVGCGGQCISGGSISATQVPIGEFAASVTSKCSALWSSSQTSLFSFSGCQSLVTINSTTTSDTGPISAPNSAASTPTDTNDTNFTSNTISTFISSTASQTSSIFSSSTPTPAAQDVTLSTGAIAGIAVGAAIGGIGLFAFILFFIWRHRKRRMARTIVPSAEEIKEEKAQLHSDDYRPEFEGRLSPNIRTVGELTEMEHYDYKPKAEMPANEPAGSELRSDTNPSTDASTLVASNESGEQRR